jgi:TRAP-type C4-dicarboxylate transport system permease small subunit|tara:strand:+ start:117 stop:644 length:528 start_codon:yes stop_codon:yes gene_type:complete
LERLIEKIALLLLKISAPVIAGACLLIIYDVLARALFGAPFHGTFQIVRNVVVLIAFLQLPYAIYKRSLLRVGFLYKIVPPILRRWMDALAYLIGALIFGTLIITNWEPTISAFVTNEVEGTEAFFMPMAPVRSTALFLWLVTTLVCLVIAFGSTRKFENGDAHVQTSPDNEPKI